nr:MAG TPA: hypothetical protein [Bacteriophage sp.]
MLSILYVNNKILSNPFPSSMPPSRKGRKLCQYLKTNNAEHTL